MNPLFEVHPVASLPIYEVEWFVERKQVKFPRSKKKRIKKKWAKQNKNYQLVPLDYLITFQGKILAHPQTVARLKKALNEEDRQSVPNRYPSVGY